LSFMEFFAEYRVRLNLAVFHNANILIIFHNVMSTLTLTGQQNYQ
jgi:hypothetical protein